MMQRLLRLQQLLLLLLLLLPLSWKKQRHQQP
jgi:hypothetical protein